MATLSVATFPQSSSSPSASSSSSPSSSSSSPSPSPLTPAVTPTPPTTATATTTAAYIPPPPVSGPRTVIFLRPEMFGPRQSLPCDETMLASDSNLSRNTSRNKGSPIPAHSSTMASFPNSIQPRSEQRASSYSHYSTTSTSADPYVIGPLPPQIQLQFLEDQPLPPPQSSSSVTTMADSDSTTQTATVAATSSSSSSSASTPSATTTVTPRSVVIVDNKLSETAVVERKDSGYGGSLSRRSSLAVFGKSFRRVFGRTPSKSSTISTISSSPHAPPTIDCNIPQDVLDHEGWAQDLSLRLTLTGAENDNVASWLHQLPSQHNESLKTMDLAEQQHCGHPDSMDESDSNNDNNNHGNSSTLVEPIDMAVTTIVLSAAQVPYPSPPRSPAVGLLASLNTTTPLSPLMESRPAGLDDKPQPPLPQSTVEGPTKDHSTGGGFAGLARKISRADFGMRRRSPTVSLTGTNTRPLLQHQPQQRPYGSVNEAMMAKEQPSLLWQKQSRPTMSLSEQDLPGTLFQPSSLVVSPDEISSLGYESVKPYAKRSIHFLKGVHRSERQDSNNGSTSAAHQPLGENSPSLQPRPKSEVLVSPWPQLTHVESLDELASTNAADDWPLAPPEPLFYSKGGAQSAAGSSTSSLGEGSAYGSTDYSLMDSSADEWDGHHPHHHLNSDSNTSLSQESSQLHSSRYSRDLKGLQALLFKAAGGHTHHPHHHHHHQDGQPLTPKGSASNLNLVPSAASPKVSPLSSVTAKVVTMTKEKPNSKKDDYMSHRLSTYMQLEKTKMNSSLSSSKSKGGRGSMAYGGGEFEIVPPAKFDSPEAIARNMEIRKFISREIYTTEVNYLQYLQTIEELFVQPLFSSLESERPFVQPNHALVQLLNHIPALIAVSTTIVDGLGAMVEGENWSDEESMVGTLFLDVKGPLSAFLKYGQCYAKGSRGLRSLLKANRASLAPIALSNNSVLSVLAQTPTSTTIPLGAGPSKVEIGLGSSTGFFGAKKIHKRRSLPSALQFSMVMSAPEEGTIAEGVVAAPPKPKSSHGFDSLYNCPSNQASAADLLTITATNNNATTPANDDATLSQATMPLMKNARRATMSSPLPPLPFEIFLRDCMGHKDRMGRFSLADLLILPIQRITRYCLLLRDLKRHTSNQHEDYIGLVHALEQLHTLALATNDVQKPTATSIIRLK